MTDASEPLPGEVLEPAKVVRVQIGDYDGRGAMREYPAKSEVVYLGSKPRVLPCPITIDGKEMIAVEAVPTRNNGTTMLIVREAS